MRQGPGRRYGRRSTTIYLPPSPLGNIRDDNDAPLDRRLRRLGSNSSIRACAILRTLPRVQDCPRHLAASTGGHGHLRRDSRLRRPLEPHSMPGRRRRAVDKKIAPTMGIIKIRYATALYMMDVAQGFTNSLRHYHERRRLAPPYRRGAECVFLIARSRHRRYVQVREPRAKVVAKPRLRPPDA